MLISCQLCRLFILDYKPCFEDDGFAEEGDVKSVEDVSALFESLVVVLVSDDYA